MQKIGKVLLFLLAFGVAGYALYAYLFLPLGSAVHPDMMENFQAHPVAIYTHIFASIIALGLGPFQLSERFRQRNMALHRWQGRAYLGVGILLGGLAGLYVSFFAYGGPVSTAGFGLLATLWLTSGFSAFIAIRRGAKDAHRRWMVRNYALTFAAVTLRFYLPASMIAGADFDIAYPLISWMCWVPNIFFAEWWNQRAGKPVLH
jgi:uncharacterized membrane protein